MVSKEIDGIGCTRTDTGNLARMVKYITSSLYRTEMSNQHLIRVDRALTQSFEDLKVWDLNVGVFKANCQSLRATVLRQLAKRERRS